MMKARTAPTTEDKTDVVEDKFPEMLLSQPASERLEYFREKILRHPHLDTALDRFVSHVRSLPEGGTVNVFGPTGVGKTTLASLAEERLAGICPLVGPFAHCRPTVSLPAATSQLERFTWKTFLNRLLLHLDQQFTGHGVEFGIPGIHRTAIGRLIIERTVPAADLRRAVEELLIYVGPSALLIDEAPHMNKLSSGARTIYSGPQNLHN